MKGRIMKENTNFITGSLIRETYDSNKLVDRKIISECILNIEAWRELALQEKDLGIETSISIGQKENQIIVNSCTKVIGDTKVIYFHNRL
jgi:hypothetical protein